MTDSSEPPSIDCERSIRQRGATESALRRSRLCSPALDLSTGLVLECSHPHDDVLHRPRLVSRPSDPARPGRGIAVEPARGSARTLAGRARHAGPTLDCKAGGPEDAAAHGRRQAEPAGHLAGAQQGGVRPAGSCRPDTGCRPARGVVEGGEIPYQPWAAKKKLENYANRQTADPLAKLLPARRSADHVHGASRSTSSRRAITSR